MPTAEAERLTAEYQRRIVGIADRIGQRIGAEARRADTADVDGWWDRIGPQVQREILTGQGALATMARRYLRAQAEAEGVELDPVRVDLPREQVSESLRISGPVAFKRHMAATGSEAGALRVMVSQLEGASGRLVLEGPRQTAMETWRQRRAVEGWRRVAAGRGCAFCLMLVSRGAVYSRSSVRFQAHDHCRCTAVLVYRREQEPQQVQDLQRQWREVASGLSGSAALAAWRRHVADQGD